jgi:subtilisin-like proprotein convertase family protein
VEALEERDVPAGFFLTGVGGFTSPPEPFARIYDATTPGATSNVVGPGNINAFPGFSGSVRVASGDVNGDGVDDIITAQGAGFGSGSQVVIFDGQSALFGNTAAPIASFFVYSNTGGASQTPGFAGGVFVAAADFDDDGFDELVTSPGLGASGHLKVFDFNTGGTFLGSAPALVTSFFAYPGFLGEIRITTLTRTIGGVEVPFLVTASGAGTSQSDVRIYANPHLIGSVTPGTFVPPAVQLFPFPGYNNGVSVAAGDTDGDGNDELFVSKNDGVSTVLVFDVTASAATQVASFTAFEGFLGEVRLGAADVDGDGEVEVLTSTGSSPGAQGSHIKAWDVTGTPVEQRSFFAYQGYIGGVFLSTNDFTWEQDFDSADTPLLIPDNTLLGVNSTITVDPETLTDTTLTPKSVEVELDIDPLTVLDNANEDLDVFLFAPDGTILELFSDVNVGGSGFDIRLSDDADTAIEAALAGAPLTGTFRPETPGSLGATFGDLPVAGNWTLFIRDDNAGELYQLTSWSLRFVF